MLKAALHNLGCKVNAYETEVMEQLLIENGFEIVDFNDLADVYVINTCSVTNIADRKSRQMIHQAARRNPDAIIVAAGCYVQTSKEEAEADPDIDIIIGNNEKNSIVELIKDCIDRNNGKTSGIHDLTYEITYEDMLLKKTMEHTRAFIKVQDGCNQFCTYCIIPYARGRVRSRSIEEILREVELLVKSGVKEVVLTGIHVSSYGVDTGSSLIELIETLNAVEGLERIRLSSLEPRIITDEFAERLRRLPKICPHFHLSLQSGSDTVLQRMNRKYDTAEYAMCCVRLRKAFEHPAITTDIICGFPQESDEEFIETCEFVKRIEFFETHLFKYSKRKGTVAAGMTGQIVEAVKAERSRTLSGIQSEYKRKFMSYYIGRNIEILVEDKESINGKDYFVGLNKEYVRILIPAEDYHGSVNEFVTVTPNRFLNEDSLVV
ncbi:MAG: tRNA (N(6)-L-threonylcarbamoyladenosine(37)-C(2))-methylthiotransferase MtaB [Lachnospiraceae bacterium]|nr:tRNA (N(6)-L-threonylcarbamoyladenosine(37)-C(2))-methylthiotransferase MtaB [Lachnospiraceae bacterium]